MTISTSVRRAGPFTGTGAVVDYPFTFKVFSPEDARPYLADADGNERRLQYPGDYSVTLNPNQETHPGGVLRLTTALPAGHKLTIISEMPISQPTEYTNQGGFYPRTLNDSLDRLTIYIQQLQELQSRTLAASVNAGEVPTLPAPAPHKFLRWNDSGDGFYNDDLDVDRLLNEAKQLRDEFVALGAIDVTRFDARVQAIEQQIAAILQTQGEQEARMNNIHILALAGL